MLPNLVVFESDDGHVVGDCFVDFFDATPEDGAGFLDLFLVGGEFVARHDGAGSCVLGQEGEGAEGYKQSSAFCHFY